MSYCRWSSDNFACDLYCYEDVSGGWTTHVASLRILGHIPKVPDLDICQTEKGAAEWMEAHNKQSEFVRNAIMKPIGGPHDGETFNDPTLADFKRRLIYLRSVGYKFPKYVLRAVEEELVDAKLERENEHTE